MVEESKRFDVEDFSRRRLIQLGQAAILATAVPAWQASAEWLPAISDAQLQGLGLLTRERFAPQVDSSFAVRSTDNQTRAWLRLITIEDQILPPRAYAEGLDVPLKGRNPSQPGMTTFTLKFFGAGGRLEQGTYEFTHAALGVFSLFIVPGSDFQYTATINHLETLPPGITPPIKSRPKASA